MVSLESEMPPPSSASSITPAGMVPVFKIVALKVDETFG
jgi:hypothetical protein